jgi:hypothetical protein
MVVDLRIDGGESSVRLQVLELWDLFRDTCAQPPARPTIVPSTAVDQAQKALSDCQLAVTTTAIPSTDAYSQLRAGRATLVAALEDVTKAQNQEWDAAEARRALVTLRQTAGKFERLCQAVRGYIFCLSAPARECGEPCREKALTTALAACEAWQSRHSCATWSSATDSCHDELKRAMEAFTAAMNRETFDAATCEAATQALQFAMASCASAVKEECDFMASDDPTGDFTASLLQC